MTRIGSSLLTWTNTWNPQTSGPVLEAAAAAGLDFLEIPILDPGGFDAARYRKQLDDVGLGAITGGLLPPDAQAADRPDAALAHLERLIDLTAELGAPVLGGVLYGTMGVTTGAPATRRELDAVAQLLGDAGRYAAERGIRLAIEPINRYESHLVNTVADALGLIEAGGSDAVGITADTYHMNIEEASPHDALVAAGSRLVSVQLSENDRDIPGRGSIDFDAVFSALAEIGFSGDLYLEVFSANGPGMPQAAYWRSPSRTTADLLGEFLPFVRERIAAAGLG